MAKQSQKINNALGVTAQTQFFHLFKTMFDSGEVARMGSQTFAVYAYIKSCVNYDRGDSFPSVKKICEHTGVSRASVFRCLSSLSELGYINTVKRGRNNVYTLNERIPLLDEYGDVQATASWEYVPKLTTNAVQELKDVLQGITLTGDTKYIHIDKLQVVVSNVEAGATQMVYNGNHNQSIDLETGLLSGLIQPEALLVNTVRKRLEKKLSEANEQDTLDLQDKLKQLEQLVLIE